MKKIVFFFAFLLILVLPARVYATQPAFSEDEKATLGLDKTEAINPGTFLYPVKRLGEKFKLSFIKKRENKAIYLSLLLQRRFRETIYVDEKEKSGFFVESANRFNTQVGQIKSDYSGLDAKLKTQIPAYVSALEKLRDKYSSNSANWLIFQQSLDTIHQLE